MAGVDGSPAVAVGGGMEGPVSVEAAVGVAASVGCDVGPTVVFAVLVGLAVRGGSVGRTGGDAIDGSEGATETAGGKLTKADGPVEPAGETVTQPTRANEATEASEARTTSERGPLRLITPLPVPQAPAA